MRRARHRTVIRYGIVALFALAGCFVTAATARADDSASPSPSPAATLRPGETRVTGTLMVDGVGGGFAGPGTTPVEAAAFAAGSPVSPGTPYDFFNSAPLVPGYSFSSQALVEIVHGLKAFDLRLRLGAQTLAGSSTNNAYWAEPSLPTLDPHVSANRFNAPIVFPSAPGGDDRTLTRGSILTGEISSKDRGLRVRGGWFDLIQTDAFVFAPAPRPDIVPGLGETLPESQGNGLPAVDAWISSPPALPLYGVDAYASRGPWSFEATDAALPAPPGTDARMTMASLVYALGKLRLSAQVLHAFTGGAAIASTTLYGFGLQVTPSAQGPLATSQLAGQTQTVAGIRASLGLAGGTFTGEYGRSTYATAIAANPGSAKPGAWYHAAYARKIANVDVTADLYRFEPRYATMILPYGSAENVWAVAYSWPGPWLKGTYQLVDTSAVGIDREGVRVRGAWAGSRAEVRGVFAAYRQIEPIDLPHATLEGWVEGYYLPQLGPASTLGHQKQYGLWLALHPAIADITVEALEDTQHRDSASPFGVDAVSMRYPQWTLSISRKMGKMLAVAGLGRFGLYGNFSAAAINADLAERIVWAGAQVAQNDRSMTQVTVRWYAASGNPVSLGGLPPAMHGTQVFLEQRLSFGPSRTGGGQP